MRTINFFISIILLSACLSSCSNIRIINTSDEFEEMYSYLDDSTYHIEFSQDTLYFGYKNQKSNAVDDINYSIKQLKKHKCSYFSNVYGHEYVFYKEGKNILIENYSDVRMCTDSSNHTTYCKCDIRYTNARFKELKRIVKYGKSN